MGSNHDRPRACNGWVIPKGRDQPRGGFIAKEPHQNNYKTHSKSPPLTNPKTPKIMLESIEFEPKIELFEQIYKQRGLRFQSIFYE